MAGILASPERLAWDGLVADGDLFTRPDVAAFCGISPHSAKRIVQHWIDEGLVKRAAVDVGKRMRHQFQITRLGRQRVEDGALPSPTGNMWTAIRRQSRYFEARDILGHANARGIAVSLAEVEQYCRDLVTAGYLRLRREGRGDGAARYQIIRNTGPLAPVPQVVEAVYDPNLGDYSYVYGAPK